MSIRNQKSNAATDLKRSWTLPTRILPRTNATVARKFSATNLPLTIGAVIADHGIIILMGALLVALFHVHPAIACALYIPACVISASRMRALENLTHEGSHTNWTRRKAVNDFLCNLLAATPVASEVTAMRRGHAPHHDKYQSSADPDKKRHEELYLMGLDRSGVIVYTMRLLRRLPKYTLGFWRAINANPSTAVNALFWHIVVLIFPLSLVVGNVSAVILWALFWLVPFLFVLPVLRFMAEAAEHEYSTNEGIEETTYSNIGWIHSFCLHPHGDGYHLLHHQFCAVPWHQLPALHDYLMEIDPEYRAANFRYTVLNRA